MTRSCTIRRLAALLACALLLVVLSGGASAETSATRLRVAPAVSELEVGEVVTLEVRVEDVTHLYGYQVYLDYDPALLQAVDAAGEPANQVELGAFFAADFVVSNAVDAVQGRIAVETVNMGSDPSSGSGVLLTLRFKGLARGVASVRIDDGAGASILADTDGMAIPYGAQSANLYVGIQAPEPPSTRLCLPIVVGGTR